MSRELSAIFFCCALLGCASTDQVAEKIANKQGATTNGDFSCPESCNDDNMCTADYCNAAELWCDHVPVDGIYCYDGDACAFDEMCHGGVCVAPHKFSCDDGNSCTTDACDAKLGSCIFLPMDATCSDGDACTQLDTCKNGACIAFAAFCDDGDACTDSGGCNPLTGCVNNLVDVTSVCDDGDAQTVDYCSPETFCQHVPQNDYDLSLIHLCMHKSEDEPMTCMSMLHQVHQSDGSWKIESISGADKKICLGLAMVCSSYNAPPDQNPFPVTFNLLPDCVDKPDAEKVYLGGDKLKMELAYGTNGHLKPLSTAVVSFPAVPGKPSVVVVGLNALCTPFLKQYGPPPP